MIEIHSAFDSGNIEVLGVDGGEARLAIRKDHQSEFFQWFHFRVSGAKGQELVLRERLFLRQRQFLSKAGRGAFSHADKLCKARARAFD